MSQSPESPPIIADPVGLSVPLTSQAVAAPMAQLIGQLTKVQRLLDAREPKGTVNVPINITLQRTDRKAAPVATHSSDQSCDDQVITLTVKAKGKSAKDSLAMLIGQLQRITGTHDPACHSIPIKIIMECNGGGDGGEGSDGGGGQ